MTPGRRHLKRLLQLTRVGIFGSILVVAWVILAYISVGTWLSNRQDHQQNRRDHQALKTALATQHRQHEQLVESCIRLNILRAEDNRSNYADYLVDKFVETVSTPPPNATSHKSQIARQFLSKLHVAVGVKSWIPLTNCRVAVILSGVHYRSPQPISFIAAKPPSSALSPTNAAQVVPKDSVS